MDDQLRRLERAARAAPDEPERAWALLRALERSGDAVRAWRIRCQLARGGDDAAWDGFRWAPQAPKVERRGWWPFGRRASTISQVRRRLPAVDLLVSRPEGLLVGTADELLLLDPVQLTTRWSTPRGPRGESGACVSGPLLVHTAPDGLVLRELRTGAELARRPLPPLPGATASQDPVAGRSRALSLRASADRLLVRAIVERPGETGGSQAYRLVLALDERLELLALEQEPEAAHVYGNSPFVARDLLIEELGPYPALAGELVVRGVDGQERWRLDRLHLANDDRSVLVYDPSEDGSWSLHDLASADGRDRWTIYPGHRSGGLVRLGPTAIVLAYAWVRDDLSTFVSVEALRREDGHRAWEALLQELPGERVGGLALADGLVYALEVAPPGRLGVRSPHGPAGAARLVALDAATGAERWGAPVAPALAGAPGESPWRFCEAVDDGVVLGESPGGETVLHRLGAP